MGRKRNEGPKGGDAANIDAKKAGVEPAKVELTLDQRREQEEIEAAKEIFQTMQVYMDYKTRFDYNYANHGSMKERNELNKNVSALRQILLMNGIDIDNMPSLEDLTAQRLATLNAGKNAGSDSKKKSLGNRPRVTPEEREANYAKSMKALEEGSDDDKAQAKKIRTLWNKKDSDRTPEESELLQNFRKQNDPAFAWDEQVKEEKRARAEAEAAKQKTQQATATEPSPQAPQQPLATEPVVATSEPRTKAKPDNAKKQPQLAFNLRAPEWRKRLLDAATRMETDNPSDAEILREAIGTQDLMLWADEKAKDQSPQYLRHIATSPVDGNLEGTARDQETHRKQVIAAALKGVEDMEKQRIQIEKNKNEKLAKDAEHTKHVELVSFPEFASRFRQRVQKIREGSATRKTLEKIIAVIDEQVQKNRTTINLEEFTPEEREAYEMFAPLAVGDVLDARVEAMERDVAKDQPVLTIEQIQEHLGQMNDVMAYNSETGVPEQGFVFQSVETQNGNGIQMVRLEKDGEEIICPLDEVLELNGLPQKRLKETDKATVGAIVAMAWEDPKNAQLIDDFFVGFKPWSSLSEEERQVIVGVYQRAYEVNPRMVEDMQYPGSGLILAPQVIDAEHISPDDPRYVPWPDANEKQEPIDAEFTVDGKPGNSQAAPEGTPSSDFFKDFYSETPKSERGTLESVKDFLYKYRETAGRLALAAVARMGFGVVGGSSLWDVGKFVRDHHKVFGNEGLADVITDASKLQRDKNAAHAKRRAEFDASPEGEEFRQLKAIWKGALKPDGTYEGGQMTPEQQARFDELLNKRIERNPQRTDFYEKYGEEYKTLRQRKMREGAPNVEPLSRQEMARYQELRRMRSDGFNALEDVYAKLAYIKGGETKNSLQRGLIASQLLEYYHRQDLTLAEIRERADNFAWQFLETKTTAIQAAKGVVNTAILGASIHAGMPWAASSRVLNMGFMDILQKKSSMEKEAQLENFLSYKKVPDIIANNGEIPLLKDEKVGFFQAAVKGTRETFGDLVAKNPSKDSAIRVRRFKAFGTIGSYVAVGFGGMAVRGMQRGYEYVSSGNAHQKINNLLHDMREHFGEAKPRVHESLAETPPVSLPYKGDAKITVSKESEHGWRQAGGVIEKAYQVGKKMLHINTDHAFNEAPGTADEFRETDPLGSVGSSLGKINVEDIHGKAISNALNVVVKEHFKPQLDHVAKVFGENSEEYKKVVNDNVAKALGGVLQHPQSFGLKPGAVVINGFTEEQLRGMNWERGLSTVFGDHESLAFSDTTLTNLVAKDATLKEFFDAHPTIPVTGHNIDAVFAGKGNDLALMANQPVETPMLTRALTGTETGVEPKVGPGADVEVELSSRDLHNDIANVLGGDETDVTRLYEKVGAKNDEDFIVALEKFMSDRPKAENVSERIRDSLRALNRMSDESALRGLADAAKTEPLHMVDIHGKEIAEAPQEPTLESTKTTPYDPSGVEAHEHANGVKHLVGKPPLRPEDTVSEEGEAIITGPEIPRDGAPVASLFERESKLLKEFQRDFPNKDIQKTFREWATQVDQHHLRPGGYAAGEGGKFSMDKGNGTVHSEVKRGIEKVFKAPNAKMMKHPFVQEVLRRIDERYKDYFQGIEKDLAIKPGETSSINPQYAEDAARNISIYGREEQVLPNPFEAGDSKKP